MKKRYLIMLIIVIALVICIGAGLAFVYFFTDTFKSNRALFIKYFTQNSEILNFINDADIQEYSEKQKQTPYTLEGTIKTNVTFPDSSEATIANALQNCNITFDGKVDNLNKYFSETIKANYSDTQSMEFNLYRNSDIYAFKIGEVLYKYVGIENNNLKDFAKKMNLPEDIISAIPNKFELKTLENSLNIYSQDDISSLKDKYLKIITDNLTDDMFSKEKTSEDTVYSITINETQAINILVKILETLKDDEIIINKLKANLMNNYNLTEETINPYINQYKELIQHLIDNLNSNSSTSITENETTDMSKDALEDINSTSTDNKKDFNLIIKVHSQKSKLIKTEFILNDIGSIILSNSDDRFKIQIFKETSEVVSAYIQKIKSPTETKFEIVFSYNDEQIFDLTVSYSGFDTNSVHESSELSFDIDLANSSISNSKTKFVSSYQNTKTFGNVEKEELPSSDILLLNTAPSKENIETLYKNIETKLIELNKTKLQALGLTEDQNPFIYYIPSIATIGSTYVIQNPDKAQYFSIPTILAGTSIAMLNGDNTILREASNKTNETNIANVKEDIMLTVNQALVDYNSTNNKSETSFSYIEKALKNFKPSNNNIEYTYNNRIITIKNKNTSETITGTLSDDGNIKWN